MPAIAAALRLVDERPGTSDSDKKRRNKDRLT